MKTDLELAIILQLMQKGKQSATDLAERFQISKRSVLRHLSAISVAGVPIFTEYGRNGGFKIDDNYKIQNLFLSKPELARLNLYLSASPASAVDNIDQGLKQKLQLPIYESDIIFIDNTCWSGEKTTADNLKLLSEAIKRQINLDLTYFSGEKASRRIVSPLTLINKECKWYLLGYCHLRQDYRIFKVSKLVSVSLDDSPYKNASLSPEFIKSMLDKVFHTEQITLELDTNLLPDCKEWLNVSSTKLNGNRAIVSGTANVSAGLATKILSYGTKLKVLSPTSLQEQLVNLAQSVLKNY